MKHLLSFEDHNLPVNEGLWDAIFGKPTTIQAADTHLKKYGWSGRGGRDDNYVMFNGEKFYPDQIEYDDPYSTKDLPRIENGKLIIANPIWKE